MSSPDSAAVVCHHARVSGSWISPSRAATLKRESKTRLIAFTACTSRMSAWYNKEIVHAARLSLLIAIWLVSVATARASGVEDIFSGFNREDSPGCAVGIEQGSQPALIRAFGSADLE